MKISYFMNKNDEILEGKRLHFINLVQNFANGKTYGIIQWTMKME